VHPNDEGSELVDGVVELGEASGDGPLVELNRRQRVSCPTRQELHATFSVAKDTTAANDKVWTATLGNGYTAVLSRLVAAGLYEHQLRFIDSAIAFPPEIPKL
jgi:roadblock/LC7 domain-containing protein